HGGDNLEYGYHRAGGERRSPAIVGAADESRVLDPAFPPEPSRRAPWGRPGDDPHRHDRPREPPDTEGPPSMTTEHAAAQINAWAVAQQQFDLAAERLNLDP